MNIENMTSEDLYKLAKQKEAEENKRVRPEVILPNNCSENIKLIRLAESYMDDEESGEPIDTQFAFELIMELVYGDDVFDYINSLRR